MKALFSPTAGLIFAQDRGSSAPNLINLIGMGSPERALPLIADWASIELDVRDEAAIDKLRIRSVASAAAWRVTYLLGNAHSPLQSEILEGTEADLQAGLPPSHLSSRLLIAPLLHPDAARELAKSAIALGLSATGSVLDAVRELQPNLRRLSEVWLNCGGRAVASGPNLPQRLWTSMAALGTLHAVVQAVTAVAMHSAFLSALAELSTSDRVEATAQINRVAESLFPNDRRTSRPAMTQVLAPDSEGPRRGSRRESGHSVFVRVQDEISTIVEHIARGQDLKARQFMRELVNRQSDEPERAIQTLSNIAQRSKELYRTDFEGECLRAALEQPARDAHLFVQYGDYLKRCGDYAQALVALEKATGISDALDRVVPLSAAASVYSAQRRYDDARRAYLAIENWQNTESVLTALADLDRWTGDLAEARRKYVTILQRWPGNSRSIAGLAEILKHEGDLAKSESLYRDLLAGDPILPSRLVWQLALANVLKQSGRLMPALELLDSTVQRAPFMMQARAERGAVLGLLGRQVEGLVDLPDRKIGTAANEWLQQYVRGLLLQSLSRFSEARAELIDRLSNTVLTGESETRLRLAAAVCLLRQGDALAAEDYLSVTPANPLEVYITQVLKAHAAAIKSQFIQVSRFLADLRGPAKRVPLVARALRAIESKHWNEVSIIEVELLLCAA